MGARCITNAEIYLQRGRAWDSLPPQDGPTAPALDINRINRLGLAAWTKLIDRFSIGDGIDIDLATGAWTDSHNGRTGTGVVALVAHIARSTVADVAVEAAVLGPGTGRPHCSAPVDHQRRRTIGRRAGGKLAMSHMQRGPRADGQRRTSEIVEAGEHDNSEDTTTTLNFQRFDGVSGWIVGRLARECRLSIHHARVVAEHQRYAIAGVGQ